MDGIAQATLSESNLIHNIGVLKQFAPRQKIVAIIKANAYGHGMIDVAKKLQVNFPDIYGFGVARVDEAIILREAGINKPIIMLEGVFEKNDLVISAEKKFHPVFHNQQQLSWLKESKLPPNSINAWLKIETGMNRIGFKLNQAEEAYQALVDQSSILRSIVIMSHFACADEKDHPLNKLQIHNFNNFITKIPQNHFQILRSLNNSAGTINSSSTNYEIIRSGIMLYGYSPVKERTTSELNLNPILTLETKIIATHNLKKGDQIGYGGDFVCDQDIKIAVAAIGYGDGYSRTIRSGAPVLVNGIRSSLVGRVSMDMITIDISNNPRAKIGDQVILWGKDLPVDEVAKFSSCCVYDLLCGIQNRVHHVWK